MGNLRPAPAALTPQRIDSLLRAIDQHDGLPLLRELGLTAEEIDRIRRLPRNRGVSSLPITVTLIRAALEAVTRCWRRREPPTTWPLPSLCRRRHGLPPRCRGSNPVRPDR